MPGRTWLSLAAWANAGHFYAAVRPFSRKFLARFQLFNKKTFSCAAYNRHDSGLYRDDDEVMYSMGISKRAADAYTLFKKAKKIKTYGKLVLDSVDEDTRPGALMKLGIRGTLEIAGKALGVSLLSHPYFTFHKAHLEALALALNASATSDSAKEALNRAIRSADSTAALTKSLSDYRSRNKGLLLNYGLFVKGYLELLSNPKDPEMAKEIQESGLTPESMKTKTDQNIYEWLAMYCELFLDSVQLLTMAHVEYRTTQAAMQKFDQKMKTLSSGGSIGKVFAYGAEQDRQWAEFDRATNPGTGSQKAVSDPVGFARDQVYTIQTISDQLGENCETAMGDEAYRPEIILHAMNAL